MEEWKTTAVAPEPRKGDQRGYYPLKRQHNLVALARTHCSANILIRWSSSSIPAPFSLKHWMFHSSASNPMTVFECKPHEGTDLEWSPCFMASCCPASLKYAPSFVHLQIVLSGLPELGRSRLACPKLEGTLQWLGRTAHR